MAREIPFLTSDATGFFIDVQLRAIHRNLGRPSGEKQMRVIETADIKNLPADTRKKLEFIVKHCRPCRMKKLKPRRFLLSIKNSRTES